MKIRLGFVSNSSTSSFIAIGFLLSELTETQEREICIRNNVDPDHGDRRYLLGENADIIIREGYENGIPDGGILVSIQSGFEQGEEMPEVNISIEKMLDIADTIMDKTGLDGDPKIISGIRET